MSFQQNSSDDFTGKWKTPEGHIVLISKTSGGFEGTTLDKKLSILRDIKKMDGKWSGIIENPKSKSSAKCDLALKNGKLEIVAKKGLMSKKIVWERL
ncbi:hypothetical protein CMU59_18300 [Elizabethkingia anophelis]|nr:hypothetical protein [Elizabethkingia anophelis]MDV3601326.1 hypothetical protein [Elizabethkingia anophelis]MDV3608609.1 hypothetical protein [Elizabethkingia anophelis]MDV3640595.1 hypothetical protein [Elizabethkingia anophelis]MDV3651327.1 hypothetical protein [Elizabethkingia anophelis]